MPLAEGVQGVIYYKAYASGAIVSNVEDLAPGTSGAQTLRRVSSTLNLKKNTYTSAEIRPDRQIFDFRHGARHVDGDRYGRQQRPQADGQRETETEQRLRPPWH